MNDSPVQPSARRRIVRNAASILLGDAAGEVLVGYAIVLAAASLGPAGFGRLSEGQAFMEPFDSLAALGLGNVAITMAAGRGDCDATLRGTVWGIRTVSATIAAFIGFGFAFATGRGNLLPLLIVLAVGMLVSPVSVVSLLPFQFNQTIHRRIAVPFVVGLVRLGSAYLAFWFLRRPVGFQLSALAAGIAAAAINWAWARRVYRGRLRFDRQLAVQMLRLGWPAAVLEFFVALYTRAAYFFLHGAGAAVQGQYAAADRLIKPVMAVAGAVFLSSLPTVAGMVAARQHRALQASYRRSVLQVTFGFLPFAALAWVAANWLLHRFAPAYTGAIWPFRALVVGAFFMFLNMLSTTYIISLGQFRTMMIVSVFNLAVYLILAAVFIPRYGAVGAAIATAAMEAVNTIVQLSIVHRLLARAVAALAESPPPLAER
ncbi:MAG: polysaccharide biosynthesis C-terminal domain-containing protein [Polyangiaceae bacterium]